jgi:AcrR family transcriptional regulator
MLRIGEWRAARAFSLGPNRISAFQIATRCGYSRLTIHHYFGDEDGRIDARPESGLTDPAS